MPAAKGPEVCDGIAHGKHKPEARGLVNDDKGQAAVRVQCRNCGHIGHVEIDYSAVDWNI